MIFPPPSRHHYAPPGFQHTKPPSQSKNPLQSIWQRFLPASGSSNTTGTISNVLTHVQSVLKVIETTAPLIKQYGPIVKSLPTMFQMLKAFQEMESVDDNEASENMNEEMAEPDLQAVDEVHEEKEVHQSHTTQTRQSGESIPKLFI
ncbi:MAG TPA: VrrA/YqfQ family protein [Cerasibacillus sp.]|uniref:VrrA/YqfQ family protein n=1 Tax=Cerasibacillus sp. TaxID=2498711 RepID=UPI002F402770